MLVKYESYRGVDSGGVENAESGRTVGLGALEGRGGERRDSIPPLGNGYGIGRDVVTPEDIGRLSERVMPQETTRTLLNGLMGKREDSYPREANTRDVGIETRADGDIRASTSRISRAVTLDQMEVQAPLK